MLEKLNKTEGKKLYQLKKKWLLEKFGTPNLRETKYGDNLREVDKEYQREKRELGLIDKTEEYRIWRLKHPNGANAQQLVNRMIKNGKIKRKSCEFCGKEDAYAHHDNYYEPLKIRWMCPSCHQKYHLGLLVDKILLTN